MQETLAAAVIQCSGWDGDRPLYDPMCGSGTMLIEAVMHYCRIPPGRQRGRFGFEKMPDFDKDTWKRVKDGEDRKVRCLPQGLVAGSDLCGKAVSACKTNWLR